jgi:hypothetical protein
MFLLCRRLSLILLVVVSAVTLHAEERKYVLGTTIDLAAGGSNQLGSFTATQNQPIFFFYGTYPTLSLKSTGAHTVLDAAYSYGFNRGSSDQKLTDQSHSGTLKFTTALSPALKISFSEGYQATSDAASFNAIRGIAADPASLLVFSPVASRTSSRVNTASLLTSYQMSDRSSLSFTLSHGLLDYKTGANNLAPGALQNQQRFSGDMAYTYHSSKDEAWTVGYSASYFDFGQFQNAYSQIVHVGYSNQIAPGLRWGLTAGFSRVTSQGTAGNYIGYDSSGNLTKTFRTKEALSLYFSQTSGDTSGLGSISNTRNAGLSLNHNTKRVTLFANVALFDTKGTLDNTYNARGGSATASVGIPLNSSWSVQTGAQYQAYNHTTQFAFNQKRVFFTLRYTNPNLWKAAK